MVDMDELYCGRVAKLALGFFLVVLRFETPAVAEVTPPQNLVTRSGDKSIVLHWDTRDQTNLSGYRVYRSSAKDGPFSPATAGLTTSPSFADLSVTNTLDYFYRVIAVSQGGEESLPASIGPVAPHVFAKDDEFLDYIQQTGFDYFWYEANPSNGLIRDRTRPGAACSIAAVGFGLTAIGIGIDHGWITRAQGSERVARTLKTFVEKPQGPAAYGTIGYNGWFYHFLDMDTGVRYTRFNTEVSSVDTALLLGGVLYAKQYFAGTNAQETTIRILAERIYDRLDWDWMARKSDVLSMGWHPETGFLQATWNGYNEAMLLYCLGLAASNHPLPPSAWSRWAGSYTWATNRSEPFITFGPLFGHQYSHCWIDFRNQADAYVGPRCPSYFENSRRATLAQREYCIANPAGHLGYGSNIWGLTACDGPGGYSARGANPVQNDDGTIAPTAAGSSLPFTPEYSLPALRCFYDQFRTNLWTGYGFRDAFNLRANWWGPDVLGIDQGPMVIMIENYRSQSVWRTFMQNPEVQRGLRRAGFTGLAVAGP
jgi:hypothetical protein